MFSKCKDKLQCFFSNNELKFFYIFLIINSILWILVESIRKVISVDSMEAIVWGGLLDFGTNKHPPLSGWLAGSFFNLFNGHNFAIYLLGQICIAIGLIYIFKLAKNFMNERKAIGVSLIMTTCFYYTFQVFYDNFNCNIISMALWPILIYYFYKSITFNKLKDWSITGLFAGLAFLAKYQVVVVFLGMFLYLLFCKRKCFKQKGFYLSLFIATIFVTPHLFWLVQNDFFSLIYFINKTASTVDPASINLLSRMMFSIKFYLDQILALMPCFVLYLLLILKEKKLVSDDSQNLKDKLFILFIGLIPALTIGISGVFTASRVVGAWGVALVGYIGLILFYFFPIEFKAETFSYFKKWIIGIMLIWQLAMAIFGLVQTKTDMSYPYQTIIQDFNSIWYENTGEHNLKYIAGTGYCIFQFNVYSKSNKPIIILDTYNHKNPWIDYDNLKKCGCLLVSENEGEVYGFAQNIANFININPDFKIKKYNFEIKNIFNKTDEKEFYYIIINPQNN